jgi:drug/metabolite transporter (DMT)-like permease
MKEKKRLTWAIGFVLLWNSGFIGAEYGLPYAPPFTLLFWRYLALALLVLVYLLLRGRFRWVGLRAAGYNMLIGILAHGLWLACVLLALEREVPAGIVALVVALQPLATGALSGLVTGERTHLYQWIGLLLGFLGVVLTVAFRINLDSYDSVLGYLIPLGSVAGITLATLLQRRVELTGASLALPLDQTLFYQGLGTALAVVWPAFFVERLATQWEPVFLAAMGWLVLAVSLGAYSLMWLLLRRIAATQVASLFYLGPPATMLMAWLAFGDTVKLMDMVGLAVVFAGVVLTQAKPGQVQAWSRPPSGLHPPARKYKHRSASQRRR